MRHKLSAMLLGTSLAATGVLGGWQALAQEEQDPAQVEAQEEDLFSRLDTEGTGYISLQEANAIPELAEQFDRYDEDGDGRLDEAEFARFEEDRGEDTPETPAD